MLLKNKEKKKLIKQILTQGYGAEYSFLSDYISGGYEGYVKKNIDKFTYKKVFGRLVRRKELKSIYNVEEHVLEHCEKAIKYAKEMYFFYTKTNYE